MMRTNDTQFGMQRNRRGLAPLELVMWLPILLFVTALMVNLGTMQAWRIRGEIVSRDAAWRERWPRNGQNEPRPAERVWPQPATISTEGQGQINQLDHPAQNSPVIHGPLPNDFIVREVLDSRQGAYRGVSEIEREFPLLPKLGDYQSNEIYHSILDRQFSGPAMNIPSVDYRRTLVLWEMPKTDPALPDAYLNAIMDLINSESFNSLAPLDNHPDVLRYAGGRDFHPRVRRSMCTLDAEDVHETEIERLIDILDPTAEGGVRLGEISQLPRDMTDFFLNMYEQAIERLERQIQSMEQELEQLPDLIDEAPPEEQEYLRNRMNEIPDLIQSAEQEIERIEPRLEPLRQYQGRMNEIESMLRDLFLQEQAG